MNTNTISTNPPPRTSTQGRPDLDEHVLAMLFVGGQEALHTAPDAVLKEAIVIAKRCKFFEEVRRFSAEMDRRTENGRQTH